MLNTAFGANVTFTGILPGTYKIYVLAVDDDANDFGCCAIDSISITVGEAVKLDWLNATSLNWVNCHSFNGHLQWNPPVGTSISWSGVDWYEDGTIILSNTAYNFYTALPGHEYWAVIHVTSSNCPGNDLETNHITIPKCYDSQAMPLPCACRTEDSTLLSSEEWNINAYPNPNTGNFNLVVRENSTAPSQEYSISLYNNLGTLIANKKITLTTEQPEIIMQMEMGRSLSDGIYLIRVRNNSCESKTVSIAVAKE